MGHASAIDRPFPGENPLRTVRTIVLYLMYHHVMSSFFTKPMVTALALGPPPRMKLKYFERIEDDIRDRDSWPTQVLTRF